MQSGLHLHQRTTTTSGGAPVWPPLGRLVHGQEAAPANNSKTARRLCFVRSTTGTLFCVNKIPTHSLLSFSIKCELIHLLPNCRFVKCISTVFAQLFHQKLSHLFCACALCSRVSSVLSRSALVKVRIQFTPFVITHVFVS